MEREVYVDGRETTEDDQGKQHAQGITIEVDRNAGTTSVGAQAKSPVLYSVDDVPEWYLCILLGFQEKHEEVPGTWAELCGCSEGDRFLDFFNLAIRILIKCQDYDRGKRQRMLDKALVFRICLALVFNVTVLFIALFANEPHYVLVLFFALFVIGYVIFVSLISIKLWKVGFRASYYIIHIGIYKCIEIIIQVCILILLGTSGGVFEGSTNTFFSVVSIIDIILDFFQIIWFCHIHDNPNRIKPYHGEKNEKFCCITSV